MAHHLSLILFTEQGIQAIGKSTERADRFRSAVKSAAGEVEATYWALGEFDGAIVFRAPDEQTAARLLVQLGQQCNVRTRTWQGFDAQGIADIGGGP